MALEKDQEWLTDLEQALSSSSSPDASSQQQSFHEKFDSLMCQVEAVYAQKDAALSPDESSCRTRIFNLFGHFDKKTFQKVIAELLFCYYEIRKYAQSISTYQDDPAIRDFMKQRPFDSFAGMRKYFHKPFETLVDLLRKSYEAESFTHEDIVQYQKIALLFQRTQKYVVQDDEISDDPKQLLDTFFERGDLVQNFDDLTKLLTLPQDDPFYSSYMELEDFKNIHRIDFDQLFSYCLPNIFHVFCGRLYRLLDRLFDDDFNADVSFADIASWLEEARDLCKTSFFWLVLEGRRARFRCFHESFDKTWSLVMDGPRRAILPAKVKAKIAQLQKEQQPSEDRYLSRESSYVYWFHQCVKFIDNFFKKFINLPDRDLQEKIQPLFHCCLQTVFFDLQCSSIAFKEGMYRGDFDSRECMAENHDALQSLLSGLQIVADSLVREVCNNPNDIGKWSDYIDTFGLIVLMDHEKKIQKIFTHPNFFLLLRDMTEEEAHIVFKIVKNTPGRGDIHYDYIFSRSFVEYLRTLKHHNMLEDVGPVFNRFHFLDEEGKGQLQFFLLHPANASLVVTFGPYIQDFFLAVQNAVSRNFLFCKNGTRLSKPFAEFFQYHPRAVRLFHIFPPEQAREIFQKANSKFFKDCEGFYFGRLLDLLEWENGDMTKANEIFSLCASGNEAATSVLLQAAQEELMYWDEVRKFLLSPASASLRNIRYVYSKDINDQLVLHEIHGDLYRVQKGAFLKTYYWSKLYPFACEEEKKNIAQYARGSHDRRFIENLHVLFTSLGKKEMTELDSVEADIPAYMAVVAVFCSLSFDKRVMLERKWHKKFAKIFQFPEIVCFESVYQNITKAFSLDTVENIIQEALDSVSDGEFKKFLLNNEKIFGEWGYCIDDNAPLNDEQKELLQQFFVVFSERETNNVTLSSQIIELIFTKHFRAARKALGYWDSWFSEKSMENFLKNFGDDECMSEDFQDVLKDFEENAELEFPSNDNVISFLDNREEDTANSISKISDHSSLLVDKKIVFVAGIGGDKLHFYNNIFKKLGCNDKDIDFIYGWNKNMVADFFTQLQKADLAIVIYGVSNKIFSKIAFRAPCPVIISHKSSGLKNEIIERFSEPKKNGDVVSKNCA